RAPQQPTCRGYRPLRPAAGVRSMVRSPLRPGSGQALRPGSGQDWSLPSTRCGRPAARGGGLAVGGGLLFLACGCDDCNLEITTNPLPDAVVGVPYSFGLNSECGGDTWFLASFDLPPGVGLQSDGDLVGVPSVPGIFSFTIGVVDYGSGEQAF